jgi:hypothetical protein
VRTPFFFRHFGIGALALFYLVSASATQASTMTLQITGSGDLVGAVAAEIYISGPGLLLGSSTPDWGYPVAVCVQGTYCNMPNEVPSDPTPGQSYGTFDGVTGLLLEGEISVPDSSAFIPVSSGPDVNIDFPATITGDISGWQVPQGLPWFEGTEVFDLSFSLLGTGSFGGYVEEPGPSGYCYPSQVPCDIFGEGGYGFSGPATVESFTPESPALLLFGLGLLPLAVAFYRRRRIIRVQGAGHQDERQGPAALRQQ